MVHYRIGNLIAGLQGPEGLAAQPQACPGSVPCYPDVSTCGEIRSHLATAPCCTFRPHKHRRRLSPGGFARIFPFSQRRGGVALRSRVSCPRKPGTGLHGVGCCHEVSFRGCGNFEDARCFAKKGARGRLRLISGSMSERRYHQTTNYITTDYQLALVFAPISLPNWFALLQERREPFLEIRRATHSRALQHRSL